MTNPYQPPGSKSDRVPRTHEGIGTGGRVAIACVVLVSFVSLAYPWNTDVASPWRYVLGGPLWLIAHPISTGQGLGAVTASVLLLGIGAGIVWPRWYTAPIALSALGFWFGAGYFVWLIVSSA